VLRELSVFFPGGRLDYTQLHRILTRWKQAARNLKIQTYALYLAYRDPRTPWYAKVWAALVVAYAFSPIDLIPDFIPVLGYLDDLVLLPLGMALALKMIPPEVMDEAREMALRLSSPVPAEGLPAALAQAGQAMGAERPVNKVAAVVIILIWLGLTALAVVLALRIAVLWDLP